MAIRILSLALAQEVQATGMLDICGAGRTSQHTFSQIQKLVDGPLQTIKCGSTKSELEGVKWKCCPASLFFKSIASLGL